MFAVANWSRHLGVDPEESLRLANAKFERRFRGMEALARERSLLLAELDAAAWDALWNEVKRRENPANSAFSKDSSTSAYSCLHGHRPFGGFMSISTNKILMGLIAAGFTLGSTAASAQDNYEQPYDRRYEDPDSMYDYARVVDVQPLTTRVRVSTPQRECWDEMRHEGGGYAPGPQGPQVAGYTILGAAIGAVLGHQIGSGRGQDAATIGGAIVGAGHRSPAGRAPLWREAAATRIQRAALRDSLPGRMAGACRRAIA